MDCDSDKENLVDFGENLKVDTTFLSGYAPYLLCADKSGEYKVYKLVF
jgi:hypothetical protein